MPEGSPPTRFESTADDIAAAYNVHRNTVLDLARRGRIPCVRIGGQWRFNAEQVARHLYVHQVVDVAPELTDEQADRLAVILRGAS